MNFSSKRSIYKNEEYESYKYLNQYQLDEIISNFYKEIFEELLEKSKDTFDKNIYDVYLVGKASRIKNMDSYFTSISNCNSSVVTPNYLCLNNHGCVQTVGVIRLNYRKLLENKAIVENNPAFVETKESKFDKFILDEDELN